MKEVLQVSPPPVRGILWLAVLGIVVFAFTACGSRSYTKPRSELIEEALNNGERVRSLAEERRLFFSSQRSNEARLLALVRARAEGRVRDTNYRLGAGDEVEINVFDVPELNVTARVRQSGFITLPLIGAVKVLGRTEQEIQDELTKRLLAFVRSPQVSVFISEYGSQKVAVLGAVQRPGTYSLTKGTNSILELLGEAGGVSEKAGGILNFIPAELSGIGASNEVEARAQLALASQRSNLEDSGIELFLDQVLGTSGGIPLEIPVRGGDMIIVPEAGQVMVEGEVEKRVAYDLNSRTTLLGALASAGGITYSAKVDEVEVVRDVEGGESARLVVNLEEIARGKQDDVRLKAGDIVRVPSDSGRRLAQDTFDGITRVINFGIGGSVPLR